MNEIISVSTSSIAVSNEQRCLWIPRVTAISSTTENLFAEVSSYSSIYEQFAVKPETSRCSLFRYVANTIVVLQEFVLSCYFFAWHRFLIFQQGDSTKHITIQPHQRYVLDLSTTTMYVALLLAVTFNARASMQTRNKNRLSHSSITGFYKFKVLFRIVDAVVLAMLLRYVAALLHDLTVSYSTDTVELLAASAMIVHLLCCDFSYANGYQLREGATRIVAGRSTVDEAHGELKHFQAMENYRPSFLGGTVSLNAAFFATILLMSRFVESDAVTSQSSFVFVSLSVVIFAFYPVSRHTISVIYPPHRSAVHWLITAAATISTGFLLHLLDHLTTQAISSESSFIVRHFYTIMFSSALLVLGLLLPTWKQYMARFKVLLYGPWDIPSKASMNLEYKVSST